MSSLNKLQEQIWKQARAQQVVSLVAEIAFVVPNSLQNLFLEKGHAVAGIGKDVVGLGCGVESEEQLLVFL